jgi:fatty-acyl-CoA synthase
MLPTSRASIAKVFQDSAARHPDRVFLRFGDEKITYRQANETANRYAAVLADRGVGRRDVVGLMLRNSPDAVLMMLAVVKCGAVAGMLNHNQRSELLAHSIGLLDAAVVVCEGNHVTPGSVVFVTVPAFAATGAVSVGVFPDGAAWLPPAPSAGLGSAPERGD